MQTIWTLRTGNSPLSENGLITKPCGVTGAKTVNLGKQIQELKVQINHLSSAQGEEAEIQYKITVEKVNSEIGVGKQGTGISRPGINFIVNVRFLASY